jgi:predicted small secreted protein
MTRISKKPLLAIAAAALAFMAAACNTVEGAGKDVKAAGNAIEDTAQDAKN